MIKIIYFFIILLALILPAQAFQFDSLDKAPKMGVIEATYKGELYIISSARHSIPNGDIGRADGEQIAFEIATLVAKSQLAEYFKSDFDSSKTYQKAFELLDGKSNLNIKSIQKIISKTVGTVLRRVETLTIIEDTDSIQVIVGISESDFLDQVL